MKTRILILLLIAMTALVTGCVKTTILTGYTFDQEALDTLKEGKTRKANVEQRLGSPSVKSTYGDEIWYYISMEQETIAFLKPKLVSQRIVAITFDDQVVKEIREYHAENAREIALIKDVTATEGHDLSVVEQLLGNVGRFNSDPSRGRHAGP